MFEKKSARILAGLLFLRMVVFLFRASTDHLFRNPFIGAFADVYHHRVDFSSFCDSVLSACVAEIFLLATSINPRAALIKSSLPSFFAAGRLTRPANDIATRPIQADKVQNPLRCR